MMRTQTFIKSGDQKEKPFEQKMLMLDGCPAIEFCSGMPCLGSWYTDEIQLLYIKSGIFELRYGNEIFKIGKNQMVLLKRNILVQYSRIQELTDDSVEYIRFTIRYDLVKEFTKLAALPNICVDTSTSLIVKESDRESLAYISSLDSLLTEPFTPAAGLVKLKMLELFFYLSGRGKEISNLLFDVRDRYRTNITSTVQENLMNAMSVEQLATLSGRSLSSFRRDFRAIYNMPPSQWIRLKRLDKAKELLLSTTMTITDICYTLGFENIAHFSRLFKSHCGYSPSYYKMNTKAA